MGESDRFTERPGVDRASVLTDAERATLARIQSLAGYPKVLDEVCAAVGTILEARATTVPPADELAARLRALADLWSAAFPNDTAAGIHVRAFAYQLRELLDTIPAPTEPTGEREAFTAAEVIEIANETSDSFGNLYRLDFIDRIRHDAVGRRGPFQDWAEAMTEYLGTHPDHDLTAEDVAANALLRIAALSPTPHDGTEVRP